jgi:two-component system response regulator FixJ
VDDDPAFAEGLQRLLQDLGLSSKSFNGGQAFLDAYPKLSPGCVFADLVMSGMSGLDLIKELRAAGCRWPVIILTEQGSAVGAADAVQVGAFDLLEKPLRAIEVLATARKAGVHLAEDSDTTYNQEIARRIQCLSRREREVFDGVLQGLLNRQIAETVGISESAVKSARRGLMSRMGARSSMDLISMARRGGVAIKTRP